MDCLVFAEKNIKKFKMLWDIDLMMSDKSRVHLSHTWYLSYLCLTIFSFWIDLVLPYLDEEGSGEAHDVDQHDGGQAQIMNTLELGWIEMFLL